MRIASLLSPTSVLGQYLAAANKKNQMGRVGGKQTLQADDSSFGQLKQQINRLGAKLAKLGSLDTNFSASAAGTSTPGADDGTQPCAYDWPPGG